MLFHVPVGHAEHGPPSGPVYPALHVHTLDALQPLQDAPELVAQATQVAASVAADVGEYVLAPQLVHVAEPVVVLYVPGKHAEQTPPSRPVKPTLQVHAARAELASGELELPGHVTQAAASVAPVVVEYVAAAQSAQTALPVPILYLPTTHAEQTPPSAPVYPALQVQALTAEL